MEVIEFCIRGELFYFENTLSIAQTERLEDYATQYFQANRKQQVSMNDFVSIVEDQLQIALKPIKIVKVIAV